jgi:hypothetical protein
LILWFWRRQDRDSINETNMQASFNRRWGQTSDMEFLKSNFDTWGGCPPWRRFIQKHILSKVISISHIMGYANLFLLLFDLFIYFWNKSLKLTCKFEDIPCFLRKSKFLAIKHLYCLKYTNKHNTYPIYIHNPFLIYDNLE